MQFFELVILRLVMVVGIPAIIAVLVFGPARIEQSLTRFLDWFWSRRLDPETLVRQVVQRYQDQLTAQRQAVEQGEATEADILRTIARSEAEMSNLEAKARYLLGQDDELGARAALLKLNLEKQAKATLDDQLRRQRQRLADERKRLLLLDLQLKQYEVGRSLLLRQLAQAKTIDEQYAVANDFDPFHTVADWQKAEGVTLPAPGPAAPAPPAPPEPPAAFPAPISDEEVDAHLAALKAELGSR